MKCPEPNVILQHSSQKRVNPTCRLMSVQGEGWREIDFFQERGWDFVDFLSQAKRTKATYNKKKGPKCGKREQVLECCLRRI